MDEITQLGEFRADTAPMSAQAHFRGRQRLAAEAARGRGRGRWGTRPRPRLRARPVLAAAAVAVTLAVTAGVVSTRTAGPSVTVPSAQAVSALNLAAEALDSAPMPRPDQFVYMDLMHNTGSAADQTEVRAWLSVDGAQAGLYQSTGAYNHTDPVPPHQSEVGLSSAPYDTLAALPTDPDKLLQILYADPWVHGQQVTNKVSREVAVWSIIRGLVETACPAPQQAALFRAAAKLPSISYTADATDADGRSGEAVGMFDPRLGTVQLILDRNTHKFLGERVLGSHGSVDAGQVILNSTVRTVAFVDKVGQVPS
ncbi:CU044_5270 family protein [Kitasatospora sp. NPDC008050]|uniref:CU044_5270 family protein n=1 Tax=Kitasatospora sp. NPDC008050 TaxID=3364021 RepID=UPI0036DFA611